MTTSRRAAEPRVRRAGIEDVERVAPLFDAYRRFYGAGSDLAAARRYLAARLGRGESVVLLALVEASRPADGARDAPESAQEETAGFAQLYRSFSSLALGDTVILNDLFVTPAHRGRGLGSRLVDAAATYARSTGATSLELSTQHTNQPALRLYRAKGFVADTEFTRLSLSTGPARSRSEG